MKKLYSICLFFALLTFVACSPEEEDLFGKTAAERIDEVIKKNLSVLRGAKNGWVMEYYPSVSKMYGGYTMLVAFAEDGEASVSCDLFSADKVSKSRYEVKPSAGPMLTFDSYNDIFHFFSEPSNFLGIGETGKGMEGDYEFLILECTPEKVVLKGKKTGNKLVMTPIPEDKKWMEYLGAIKEISKKPYPALYDVKIGGETAYTVTQQYHMFILKDKDGSQKNLPFSYTTDGIQFYEPITIGNQNIQSLIWDNEVMAYKQGNISIQAQELPVGYRKYDDFLGAYLFVYDEGDGVAEVTLEEELFNSSFIMKGFPMDIRVLFKADRGIVGIETQILSGTTYLCTWSLGSTGSGPLTAMSGAGMEGTLQDDGTIILRDNGVWGQTDSFIAYDLVNDAAIFRIAYVMGMVKQETE